MAVASRCSKSSMPSSKSPGPISRCGFPAGVLAIRRRSSRVPTASRRCSVGRRNTTIFQQSLVKRSIGSAACATNPSRGSPWVRIPWSATQSDQVFMDSKKVALPFGVSRNLPSRNSIPSIADGQQRLATVSVMFARIRDRLHQIKRDLAAGKVDGDYLRSVDMETEERLARLTLNLEDNEYFRRCILSSPTDAGFNLATREEEAIRPSNKRLYRASELIASFIDALLKTVRHENQPATLARWVKFLENKTTVVTVRVSDEIGAYRIFETLNDRGLRASQADILKNYFFSKSGARLPEAQVMWSTISDAVEALGGDANDRLVTYLRHLWVTTHGPTKDRELAAQIKDEITGETKTLQFLSDGSSSVQDYIALWQSRHPKRAAYPASTRHSIETMASHLRVQQIRPLMFAVSRHFPASEADKAFRLFVSWSVRFLIFGGRGGMLDTQYSLRAKDVGTKHITKASELRAAMKSYVPSDTEFEAAFAVARVSRAYQARYYLRALENATKQVTQPEYVANEEAEDINLEHVLPQTPDPGIRKPFSSQP